MCVSERDATVHPSFVNSLLSACHVEDDDGDDNDGGSLYAQKSNIVDSLKPIA